MKTSGKELESLLSAAKHLEVYPLEVEDTTLLQRFESLRSLSVAGNQNLNDQSLAILNRLTSLEELDVSFCDQLTDAWMRSIISLPRLQVLNIDSCHRIGDGGLECVATSTTLRQLSARWCFNMSDVGLSRIAACKTIEKLSLDDQPRITNDGIAALATLPRLSSLELPSFGKFSDAIFATLATCKYLEELYIGPSDVTNNGLMSLENCMRLRKLGVSQCRHISAGAVLELAMRRRMTAIRLSEVHGTDDAFLASLARSLRLEEFACGQTDAITDMGVLSLAAMSPTIKTIEIIQCPHVTMACIDQMRRMLPQCQMKYRA